MWIGRLALSAYRRRAAAPSEAREPAPCRKDTGGSPSPLSRVRSQFAAHQGGLEVAPGVGDLVDVGAGEGVGALADLLAAQPLVEEARGIVGQHPQDGGVEAVGAELAEQRVEQTAADPLVLVVRFDVEEID